MYPGISSTLPQKNSLLCSKMRGVCSIRKGHVRTDMIWGNCQWYFSCMWVLGTSSSEPFPQFQTPDKPAMWASLLEKAVNAGGSICCSFAAHIFRILGMPFSHLFMLSLCFASIRFQTNICCSAQRGIWQHTCHAFPCQHAFSADRKLSCCHPIVLKDKIPWDYFPYCFQR